MDAADARIITDDRFAIFADPPGVRDLALPDLWERSLSRSRRRREATTAKIIALPKTATARISAALIAAGVVGQAGPLLGAAQAATSTTHVGHGAGVRAVQRALGVTADGILGPRTRKAIKKFQRAHGLVPDGIVGPLTRAALGIGKSAGATRTAAATGAEAAAPTSGASGVQAAVAAAMSKVGAPYSYGATGPSSFDCSGLTSWAMRQAGISIPRTSFAQHGIGTAVSKSDIQPGDLVFFNTAGPGASDVGLATSATTVVSATTHGVMNHAIFDAYWGAHFVGAKRVA
jgi:cell wall-associated NlpC family hydrolase